ncbi:MAG: orotidine-5'-phosphate decarboxylase [Planctomycetes bacterium]|nr:orotidine-5'-phosphate decarboxylase [Planctomycetota bacterium]
MQPFSNRLANAVLAKGNPLCVGIDPRWESLPLAIRRKHDDGTLVGKARAFEEFGLRVLHLVAPFVPVVKPQSAFFEACGPEGFAAQWAILREARKLDLVSILDSKRGDIASTATAYAEASFDVWDADALTVNPYLGRDAVEPFIQSARRSQRGLFILVRTSNPGSGLFQNLVHEGQPLYQHVASAVGVWNRENLGLNGLGDVGAVVGATHPEELRLLREMLPDVWFLVPGFGAQGGSAQDVAGAFRPDGLGAIINSSRGITFPFSPDDVSWEQAIVTATREAVAALRKVTRI